MVLAVLGGCGAPPDLDDPGAALGRLEELAIGAPGGEGLASPSVGEPAELYVVTRRTSERLNGVIGELVGRVAEIVRHPPTAHGDGRAVWGPIASPLSPLAYRLVAEGSPGGFRYHLDAWRKGEPADPVPVMTGEAARDGHAGHLEVDLARLRALDPVADLPEARDLAIGYDLRPEGASLGLRLGEAHYGYAARADGGGDFAFHGEGGAVRSRWLPSGAGRAEADGGVVECWDERFRRVFFISPAGVEGDVRLCADVR